MASVLLKPKVTIENRIYSVLNLIAEGGFAFVSRVKSVNLDDFGRHYAVKKMLCQSPEQLKNSRAEIALMKRIKSEKVVPCLAVQERTTSRRHVEVLILLPLFVGSMQSVIENGPGWPRCGFDDGGTISRILGDVVEGVAAIHSAGFRHADLKPANVLLKGGRGVVTDLGSASPLEVEVNSRAEALRQQELAAQFSTASFRAPELHDVPSHCVLNGKTDCWSLGCMLYTAMLSRTPFESASGLSTLALLQGTYSLPPQHPWPAQWVRVIESCLRVDVKARASLEELRQNLASLPAVDLSVLVPSSPPTATASLAPPASTTTSSSIFFETNFACFDEAPSPSPSPPAPAPAPAAGGGAADADSFYFEANFDNFEGECSEPVRR